MSARPFGRNPSGAHPWVLDRGEETELVVDIVEADGEAGRRTLGESQDYQFALVDRPNDRYSTVNERYHELLKRGEHADQFEVQPTAEKNLPTYTYTGPPDAPLLLSVEHTGVRAGASVEGFWALLEDVSPDVHPATPTRKTLGPNSASLDVSLVYLGHIDEYDDHDDLEETLRNPGLL